jgi:ribosomal protein S18 acetylase RimI-like enzyme
MAESTARPEPKGTPHPLDRPVWGALTGHHQGLAEGDSLARRYPAAISPLAGTRDDAPECFQALGRLIAPGVSIGLTLLDGATPVDPFEVVSMHPLDQMVWTVIPDRADRLEPVVLGEADVPEMLALVEKTKPGPFGPRTHELGSYLGIREGGRLVAMAGERMRMAGFTEISAVCTEPDFRGRGYGRALMTALGHAISARGEQPFLHVLSGNHAAIALYRQLGFTLRRKFSFALLRRT